MSRPTPDEVFHGYSGPHGWDDAGSISLGQDFWVDRYGPDGSFDRLADKVWVWAKALEPQILELTRGDALPPGRCAETIFHPRLRWIAWCVDWADSGYRKFTTGHKFAASLMCTKVSGLEPGDLKVPSTCFVVDVPSALLRLERCEPHTPHDAVIESNQDGQRVFWIDFDRILVQQHESDGCKLTVYSQSHSFMLTRSAQSLSEMANHAETDDGDGTTQEVRLTQLAARLVIGLCLTLQHTSNFKVLGEPKGLRSGATRSGPPSHRVVFVGKPVTIDCRPAVQQYLGLRRAAAPALQTIVRGHYKRQVVGVGRADRKLIWVEPYWRGPEEAPILVRPVLLQENYVPSSTGDFRAATWVT